MRRLIIALFLSASFIGCGDSDLDERNAYDARNSSCQVACQPQPARYIQGKCYCYNWNGWQAVELP